jgi:hypothetical protein
MMYRNVIEATIPYRYGPYYYGLRAVLHTRIAGKIGAAPAARGRLAVASG